ncbi:MAG TPA: transglycosylase SLT domain-containing protein [Burkholderiales bacterium]|nr:transglycosylase SLT domain-containing protein [Burkholderiales bacterium]
MKAGHTDSISAGLGLAWLVAALGLAFVLAQTAVLPHGSEPAAESPVITGTPTQSVPPVMVQEEQKALADYIAKRWRIAEEAAARFVATAYRAGALHSVDPVLILAVMAIESGYNPVAQSVMGAKGLMQVIPRFHLEKLSGHGGEEALLDPEVNILVGAQILREYSRRLRDEELALQMYGGAFNEPTAQYANKVFAERARLEPIRQRARKQTGQSA